MVGSSADFIKLDVNDVTNKLMALAKSKETLKIWEKKKNPQIYRIADCHKLNIKGIKTVFLTLFSEGTEIDSLFVDKKVCVAFVVNGVSYFTECEISLDSESGEVLARIVSDVYRSEKRGDERLLTFPHHQVYVYFQMMDDKELEENIFILKRKEDIVYEKYKNSKKLDLLKALEKKLENPSDYLGFRAIDVSNSGIAFTTDEDDKDYFKKGTVHDFVMLFNGEIFNLKNGSIVYNIDFIGTAINLNSKRKVGIQFNPDQKLTSLIEKIITESESLEKMKSDFEKFIDD